MKDQEQQLLEQQSRVFGVLDLATKPVQWLIGGARLILLLLIVAGVCIVEPIWQGLHGGSVSFSQLAVGLFLLGWLVLLFAAPLYTLLWGGMLLGSLFFWNPGQSTSADQTFIVALGLYVVLGWCWIVHKHRRKKRQDLLAARQRQEALAPCSASEDVDLESEFRPHLQFESSGLNLLLEEIRQASMQVGGILGPALRGNFLENEHYQFSPCDPFITDIVDVTLSIAAAIGFVSGDATDYDFHFFVILVVEGRPENHGVLYLSSSALLRRRPRAYFIPRVLRVLQQHDLGYGSQLCGAVVPLFLHVVRLVEAAQRQLPASATVELEKYVASYLDALEQFGRPLLSGSKEGSNA